MKSSQAAVDFIIQQECGSEAVYARKYTGFSWPGGASGPTVGVGCDLGYLARDDLEADWAGIVSVDTLAAMVPAIGLRGAKAQQFVNLRKPVINIPWDTAVKQFTERAVPKWEKKLDGALPNTDMLPADSYGALLSLVYNRGIGFNAQGDRYREMRMIRTLMAVKQFSKIPDQIRNMKRLWSNGLVQRREYEAQLFENGLLKVPSPIPTHNEIVLQNTVTAATAGGMGSLGGAAVLASTYPSSQVFAALAIPLIVGITVCVSLYANRHQRWPRADLGA